MSTLSRRTLLTASALIAAGCSGSDTVVAPAPVPSPGPPPSSVWMLPPITLDPGKSFDLATTLPASANRGGRFSVMPTGASLPPGASLADDGKLYSASVSSALVQSPGVVFSYVEP